MMRIAALIAYPFGLALGQVMFKLAAVELRQPEGASLLRLAATVALNPWFITAALLYAGLSIIWVWILSDMALSTAYPFVALAFVFTPLLGHWVFSEALGRNQVMGLALLVAGLLLTVR